MPFMTLDVDAYERLRIDRQVTAVDDTVEASNRDRYRGPARFPKCSGQRRCAPHAMIAGISFGKFELDAAVLVAERDLMDPDTVPQAICRDSLLEQHTVSWLGFECDNCGAGKAVEPAYRACSDVGPNVEHLRRSYPVVSEHRMRAVQPLGVKASIQKKVAPDPGISGMDVEAITTSILDAEDLNVLCSLGVKALPLPTLNALRPGENTFDRVKAHAKPLAARRVYPVHTPAEMGYDTADGAAP